MTYTKKQFIEDVKKEAVALKKNATKKELGRLNLNTLSPRYEDSCIYGQISFGCRTKRAAELIFKCCPRYVEMPSDKYALPTANFSAIKPYINGSKIKGVDSAAALLETRPEFDYIQYFSSIEAYIMLDDAKNANLIDFLKGNRTDLVL